MRLSTELFIIECAYLMALFQSPLSLLSVCQLRKDVIHFVISMYYVSCLPEQPSSVVSSIVRLREASSVFTVLLVWPFESPPGLAAGFAPLKGATTEDSLEAEM